MYEMSLERNTAKVIYLRCWEWTSAREIDRDHTRRMWSSVCLFSCSKKQAVKAQYACTCIKAV